MSWGFKIFRAFLIPLFLPPSYGSICKLSVDPATMFLLNYYGFLMFIFGCQLHQEWTKIQNMEFINVRDFVSFDAGRSTSSMDLLSRETHTFNLDLASGRHPFNQGHIFCWKLRYRHGKGKHLLFFPACSHIASIIITSLALEPTSPG